VQTPFFRGLGLAFIMLGANSLALHPAEPPKKFSVGEFSFEQPADWGWVEVASAMRKAQLRVPSADGKSAAEVIFFHFGEGSGGGTQANVDRWFRQFKEPREQIQAKSEEVMVGQRKVTYVQAQGTYLSGMPGGPQTPMPNHALQGAILESASGNVFIRMTGPIELVHSTRATFRGFVEAALRAK
jgi:hypothetical protein